MELYWASCSSGLQAALTKELQKLKQTFIISDSSIIGGVTFSTLSAPTEIIRLRAADNVYAFVGKFENIPSERDAALSFFKDLAEKAEWELPLELFWMWKKYDFTCISNNRKQKRLEYQMAECTPLSFRVSCDRACVNMKKHGFTSMEAAAALGEGICARFGWRADMCYYDLEVLAWIRDEEAVVGLALLDSSNKGSNRIMAQDADLSLASACLPGDGKESSALDEPSKKKTKKSLRARRADSQLYSWRQYRKTLVETSLKPSVAYALLHLGDILPGSIVMDPMCGCGTIPLEAADWLTNQVFCMAGDISPKCVDATLQNINASGYLSQCDLARWDASNLPLRGNVVDRILCDMPFGVRCGSTKARDSLCPKVLKEIVRVLRLGTGIAVLLSQSKTLRHDVENALSPFLNFLQQLPVQMEGLRVEVLVLQRTMEPFCASSRLDEQHSTRRNEEHKSSHDPHRLGDQQGNL